MPGYKIIGHDKIDRERINKFSAYFVMPKHMGDSLIEHQSEVFWFIRHIIQRNGYYVVSIAIFDEQEVLSSSCNDLYTLEVPVCIRFKLRGDR